MLLALGALLSFNPAIAQAPIAPKAEELITKEDMVKYITEGAKKRQIEASQAIRTITCESSWDSEAVGDNSTSFGLAQIHLPAHPDVSKEEALDPRFAMDFLLDEFAAGRQRQWTCWRHLFA